MIKKTNDEHNQAKADIKGESDEGKRGSTLNDETKTQEDAIQELENYKREAEEKYDKYLRTYAEFENYKKRTAKERTDLIKFGNERLIKDILPILDNLERALDHASTSEDFNAFVEGLKLIHENLLSSLTKHGVERIGSAGKDFDPNFHEALMQVENDEYEDNKVVEEFEKGYLLNGRLLRPAKVSIAKKKIKEKQTEE